MVDEQQEQQQPQLVVGIVIFDKVEVLDFCGPFEVFSLCRLDPNADKNVTPSPFQVKLIAERLDPIRTIGGMQVIPNITFDEYINQNDKNEDNEYETKPFDILVVPGGFGSRKEMQNEKLMTFLQQQSKKVSKLCSVCTGALLLAQAGLLNGDNEKSLQVTTHWQCCDFLQENFPQVTVVRDKSVVTQNEQRLYTAAGISAGLDMALMVVRDLFGETVARSTAKEMEYSYPETNDRRITF